MKNSNPPTDTNGHKLKVSGISNVPIEDITKEAAIGMEKGNASVHIYAEASTLNIYTPLEATVYIFTITGTLCHGPMQVMGKMQLQLPAGIYLVRVANKNCKVIIQ